jgi:hypothetical protein
MIAPDVGATFAYRGRGYRVTAWLKAGSRTAAVRYSRPGHSVTRT